MAFVHASDGGFNRERLVAALRASRCGTWRWDIANNVVEWDEALSDLYGIAHADAPKTAEAFFALVHPDDRERISQALQACFESGTEVEYDFRTIVSGETRWIYDRSQLTRAADGSPSHFTGACLDVTERKQIEEERNAALRQQELLMRELNHRVKNHLQMITGMIHLQSMRAKSDDTKAEFEKTIQRIHAIADLHALLYRGNDLGSVDIDAYLRELCDKLRSSVLPERRVGLICDAEPLRVSIDLALPLGLIVNELVINAAKYAFPENTSGSVIVALRNTGTDILLSVSDDGQGLADGQTAPQGGGGRLVRGLAEQIGAEIRVVTGAGTTFEVRFDASLNL